MTGRFSLRRVVSPGIATPAEPAVIQEPQGQVLVAERPSESAPPPAVNPLVRDKLLDAKVRLHRQLIEEINLSALEKMPEDEIKRHIQQLISKYVVAERLALNTHELGEFTSEILDEMIGLGPLEPLLKDPSISDILINGHECVYVERHGMLEHGQHQPAPRHSAGQSCHGRLLLRDQRDV